MLCSWARGSISAASVNSSHDGLHTHKEDYEIAESIARSYGFRLNNRSCFTGKSISVSLDDVLDASLELKLGFHSQMYWTCSRRDAPLFSFTGQGGGCLRNLAESLKGWDFEQNLVSHTAGSAKGYGKEIEDSCGRVIARSLAFVHGKHERAGRELDPAKAGIAFYLEARNRNHFGRNQVESFCGANVFKLCPLLDSGLRRLKNNTGECGDQNLLIAVLLDRYGKGLLDFKVEGGRGIADETKDCARRINARFPFDAGGAARGVCEAFVMPPTELVAQCDGPVASRSDLRATVKDAFFSPEVKESFEQLYSTELYYQLAQRFERVRFFPESDAYAVLAVCKARRDCDLGVSKENVETAAEFVSRCAQEARREGYPHDYLRWSLAVTRSITACIELQNRGECDCSLECVVEEGLHTNVSAPSWLAGVRGRIVESDLGSLDMRLHCLGKGELRIALRSEDVRDAQGNHVPVWIDYTSVLINGKEQLQDVTCVWHDKPHRLAFPVSDGEELDVRVQWRPHDESARNLGLEAQQAVEAKLAAARNETQRALDDLAAAQDEAREAKEDIEGLELAVAKARRALADEAARADGLAAEVARIHASNSWKAGRVVTWPARKLKRLVKRLAASGTSAS